jgi:hypothetical protein
MRRPRPEYGSYSKGEKIYTLFTCWHGSHVGVIYSAGTVTTEYEKPWQTHIEKMQVGNPRKKTPQKAEEDNEPHVL